jgi:succinate dehydrogenase / fumarate reductase flavoprotein subunit
MNRPAFSWREASLAHVDRFEEELSSAFSTEERPMAPVLFPDYRRQGT